jgi:hypothetical protein
MARLWQQVVESVLGAGTRQEPDCPPGQPAALAGAPTETARRYLLVVSREHPELVDRVRRLFLMEQKVEAVVDRRRGERRHATLPHRPDRRIADRRRRTGPEFDLSLHNVIIACLGDDPREAGTPAAPEVGESHGRTPMEYAGAATARDRIAAWIGEGRELVGLVPGLLDRLAAVELECENLRVHNNQLQRENSRLRTAQAEASAALDRILTDVAQPISEVVRKLRAA